MDVAGAILLQLVCSIDLDIEILIYLQWWALQAHGLILAAAASPELVVWACIVRVSVSGLY